MKIRHKKSTYTKSSGKGGPRHKRGEGSGPSTVRRVAGQVNEMARLGLNAGQRLVMLQLGVALRDSVCGTVKGAYLAKMTGFSARHCNRVLGQFSDLGLITRFGTGFLRLNLEKFNEISVADVRKYREKAAKWLRLKMKLARETSEVRIEDKLINLGESEPVMLRQDARSQLKATYVPVHLRKSAMKMGI